MGLVFWHYFNAFIIRINLLLCLLCHFWIQRNPSSTFTCAVDKGKIPLYVTLTDRNTSSKATLPVTNNAEQRLQHNLTVGIHAAWHDMYPSPSTLVEFIEIYLALVTTKTIAYNVSSTANLTRVLEYYTGKGVLDLHQWNLPPDTLTAHFAQAATKQFVSHNSQTLSSAARFLNLPVSIFRGNTPILNWLRTDLSNLDRNILRYPSSP